MLSSALCSSLPLPQQTVFIACGVSLSLSFSVKKKTAVSEFPLCFCVPLSSQPSFLCLKSKRNVFLFLLLLLLPLCSVSRTFFFLLVGKRQRIFKKSTLVQSPKLLKETINTAHNLCLCLSSFGSSGREKMTRRAEFQIGFFVFLQSMFLISLCSSEKPEEFLPEISPDTSPQPFLPFIAPSPMVPYINSTMPKLSGLCSLNFSASESLIQTTSHNCWTVFAPLLANVMCCPQLDATLTIILGKASKETGLLALNRTQSKHCLSDLEQILVGKGASSQLNRICSIHSWNLTSSSCPVINVDEFESTVDTAKLLLACEKVDPVKECCEEVCQNAILDAATNLSLKASETSTDNSDRINDCKNIVHRWLATKLDPSRAKETLRGLANCKINRVCPLVFPHMRHIGGNCSNELSNQTGCCRAMESYVSHLQKQTLITNLQALDCATSLGTKLQKLNITKNIFSVCHISLKDFSLQVGNQESGCLLPSLPSDAIFDQDTGISFTCDLNDNIPAPWPSSSQSSASTCKKPVRIPALPAAASSQPGLYNEGVKYLVIFVLSMVLVMHLS